MTGISSPRDVLLFRMGETVIVTAVDSCGGIGMEPHDSLKVDTALTAYFTARVAALEVMAVGAKPLFATVAISSGVHTAAPILSGVKRMLGENLPIAISTEKNMPTSMTGFGVTVTGTCHAENLRIKGAAAGDALYCAGVPLVGAQTLEPGATLFNERHLEKLLCDKTVRSVIPVGSRGIAAEATVLAGESGLEALLEPCLELDYTKTAGPSSCAVFAAAPDRNFDIGIPVYRIGTLQQSNK